MKLLKIFSAVLFFSFLGSIQNQLWAQGPEGSWTRSFKESDVLTNGDYRAKIVKLSAGYNIKVEKVSDNSHFGYYFIITTEGGTVFKALDLKYDSFEKAVVVGYDVIPTRTSTTSLVKKGRDSFSNWSNRATNLDVEVTDSAYFQLEEDGKFVIYSGTGGVPIVNLVYQGSN
jgi:hypothetical protein